MTQLMLSPFSSGDAGEGSGDSARSAPDTEAASAAVHDDDSEAVFERALTAHRDAMQAEQESAELRRKRNQLIAELLEMGTAGSDLRLLTAGANISVAKQSHEKLLKGGASPPKTK